MDSNVISRLAAEAFEARQSAKSQTGTLSAAAQVAD